MRAPMRLIVVTDGRPGHEKQTKGIIEALSRRVQVQTQTLSVNDFQVTRKIGVALQLLLPFFTPKRKDYASADLVLCAGSKTHLSALLLKRAYHLPVCVCMTPSFLMRPFFDYCFVPEHDNTPSANNIIHTLGAPNNCFDRGLHHNNEGLVLLGGIDDSSHNWESSHIVKMVREVVSSNDDVKWTVSSSPRTPIETLDQIGALADTFTNVEFFDYKNTPNGWVEKQYDRCSTVWVTSDSISMVYEAMSAGCSVNLFQMDWKRNNSKFSRNEQLLVNSGKVGSFELWEKNRSLLSKPYNLNEAQRCADKILEKWWPESLL